MLPALALPPLFALVAAFLSDGSVPTVPASEPVHGVSDEQLWDVIITGGNPLMGMTFDQALVDDPRRIDARIDQALFYDLYNALDTLHNGRFAPMMRHAYLTRNAEIRAGFEGTLPVAAMVAAQEVAWAYYDDMLDQAFGQGHSQRHPASQVAQAAERVRASLIDNRPALFRSFRAASDIAGRAAREAPAGDQQAWGRLSQLVADMWASIESRVLQGSHIEPDEEMIWLDAGVDAVESGDAAFGADLEPHPWLDEEMFGAEWESYITSGHRAPQVSLGQWRRSGGRFY